MGKRPTRAQIATPVHVDLIRNRHGTYEAILRFRSRIAVNSDRAVYNRGYVFVCAGASGLPWRRLGLTPFDGETITAHTGPLPRSITDVPAILQYSTGPALLEGPGTTYLPVDRLAIRVP